MNKIPRIEVHVNYVGEPGYTKIIVPAKDDDHNIIKDFVNFLTDLRARRALEAESREQKNSNGTEIHEVFINGIRYIRG